MAKDNKGCLSTAMDNKGYFSISNDNKGCLINVAKCNLGKVKIEPMLVAGLCLLGSADNP